MVGIITFHCAHNYGAVLQAYALKEKIKDLGFKVNVIDYRPTELVAPYSFNPLSKPISLRKILSAFITGPIRWKKYKNFENFMSNWLDLTEFPCFNIIDLNEKIEPFDICITGSDQVWNPEITVDPAYFLSFEKWPTKKISYGASFGTDNLPDWFNEKIIEYLSDFISVSVREKAGAEHLRNIINKEIYQVLDPVFLLNRDKWKQLIDNSTVVNITNNREKYVLIYSMQSNSILKDFAKRIVKEAGISLIVIDPNLKFANIFKNYLSYGPYKISIGPSEFLFLIKNASYVCTNSFHGIAFSIIFNRPFIAAPHSTRNGRIDSLLGVLGIEDQIMSPENLKRLSIADCFSYDYEEVGKKLEIEKNKSIHFLAESLGKAYDKRELFNEC